jgi:hypothetical protein
MIGFAHLGPGEVWLHGNINNCALPVQKLRQRSTLPRVSLQFSMATVIELYRNPTAKMLAALPPKGPGGKVFWDEKEYPIFRNLYPD